MLRTVAALALISSFPGAIASAQAPPPQQQDSLDRVWLAHRIDGQAFIRVRGEWGTAYLTHPRLTGDTLAYAAVEFPEGRTPLAVAQPLWLDDVERIQVRASATGTGALVGAAIGFAGGLAASLGISASLCSSGGCANETGGTVFITVGSTAGGALVGALIGASLKKWATVW